MRIGYLIGQYPAINHRYILLEVTQLRAAGVPVFTCSVAEPDRPGAHLSVAEREETGSTYYVKRQWMAAPGIHLSMAVRRPLGYLRALVCAWRLSDCHPRSIVFHLVYFAEAILVARWMERTGVTHLHVNFAMTVGMIAARVFPASMSFVVHGFGELYDPAGTRLRLKVEAASFVRSVSRYGQAQLMLSAPPDQWHKLLYAPLGIDRTEFPDPPPFRESPQPFELLCIGRLAPEKGQRLLLECVARLRRRGLPVRLHLLGDGPDRAALQQYVEEHDLAGCAVLPGAIDPSRVAEAYSRADAFVLPSLYEGVPIVLMEAMIMQVPCVAPRITGIPELIRDGVDGLLFTAGDISEMEECVDRLIQSAALRRALAQSAKQRILAGYDIRENTRRFGAILHEKLAAAPQKR